MKANGAGGAGGGVVECPVGLFGSLVGKISLTKESAKGSLEGGFRLTGGNPVRFACLFEARCRR